ncbi:MAG: malto-oligosyltrehalose synthase [Burkholderiales bacterium]|nr:malto-oligosyltrehalose synthase [Phycisphaerae bacterium]
MNAPLPATAQFARPLATYRLQFNTAFTFADAAAAVPYLARLGISHVYASPYLKAQTGSTHGYDVVDPTALNPELGTEADYDAFVETLRAHGMSHIVDIVPNHMGVAGDQNPWWNDVLEFGRASRFADFFDIAWDSYTNAIGREQVLLPILGDQPEAVTSAGELKVTFDERGPGLRYYERWLPLAVESYAVAFSSFDKFCDLPNRLAALPNERGERLKAVSSIRHDLLEAAREPEALAALQSRAAEASISELLPLQHYRLAFWREAHALSNYRRFFDVNELAAIQMEREDVFEQCNAVILRRAAQGQISGLRVDHPDGLTDPKRYFERLQEAFRRERLGVATSSAPSTPGASFYVVAEKILAGDESLPQDWQVDGTTGYDFLAEVNALFIDPAAREPLTEAYRAFTGQTAEFAQIANQCKQLLLRGSFPRDFSVPTTRVHALLEREVRDGVPSLEDIEMAIGKTIIHFSVYRTYFMLGTASDSDRQHLARAFQSVRRENPHLPTAALDLFSDVLLGEGALAGRPDLDDERWQIAKRFQQLTAPVTAKGVEDTAMYRYHRLISLNEVGNEPDHFGMSPEQLHERLVRRQQRWPYSMLTLSTHDTKRSEDVRARLNVLADIPHRFADAVNRWSRINRALPGLAAEPLDRNTEYLIYQTLLGVWPADRDTCPQPTLERIQAYALKAVRESKLHTTWAEPNTAYEERLQRFLSAVLDAEANRDFYRDFVPFAHALAKAGYINSLSQTLIKLTAPGMPDTYQGTELWDDSLVDPDNRRPVDYRVRDAMLSEIQSASVAPGILLQTPNDGRVKLFMIYRALQTRQGHRACFHPGDYLPLSLRGSGSNHLFAFARRNAAEHVITVVPRFPGAWMPFTPAAPLQVPRDLIADTAITGLSAASYHNAFTGAIVRASEDGHLSVAEVLAEFPVALLVADDA